MINIKFKLDVDSIRAGLPVLGLPVPSLLVGLDHVGLGELKYIHVTHMLHLIILFVNF